MAILYACRMFCHHSSLLAILRYLTGLEMPLLVFSHSTVHGLFLLGGLNDPFV